jgi:hypothetical protein
MNIALKKLTFLSLLSPLMIFAAERELIDVDGGQEEIVITIPQGEEVRANFIYDQYPAVHLPTSAHTIVSISAYGDEIEIENGSLWKVSSYDGRKAMQWRTDEAISIVQNTRWFSSYYYRLVNRKTGASIEANLSQGPYTNGPYTYYVTEFDFAQGIMTLSNPNQVTHWEVHPSDIAEFRGWDFNQPIPVILGDNNDYDGSPHYKWECILMNVKKSKRYIRAHQF